MSRFLIALLAGLACAPVGATQVLRYDTRVDVGPDGAGRAIATVALAGAAPGTLRLPLGFRQPASVADIAPAGAAVVAGGGEAGWIEVRLPEGIAPDATVGFAYPVEGLLFVPKPEPGQKATLPEGSRLLRHRFTATQEGAIGAYSLTVRLPDDVRVHRIREQTPKPGRKEFTPRVELDRFDGREGARLQIAGLRQGDRATMELEVVPARHSLAWLLALLPLAAGYLWFFRDLVAKDR